MRPADPTESVQVTIEAVIDCHVFPACPICGDPATHKEHIPPEAMGGRYMTKTCERCNNRLGSNVEADLIDWFEDAIVLPSISRDGIPGARRLSRIAFRTLPDGRFVLLVEGKAGSAAIDSLGDEEITFTGEHADDNRVRIALLKHAYLAACLRFGIPEGEHADWVRQELIAGRDASDRANVPPGRLANGLTVLRLYGHAAPIPPVVQAIAHLPEGPVRGAVLSGRVFVSWSSEIGSDDVVFPRRSITTVLQVGQPLRGFITTVGP